MLAFPISRRDSRRDLNIASNLKRRQKFSECRKTLNGMCAVAKHAWPWIHWLISSASGGSVYLRADVIPEDSLISSLQIRKTMAWRNTSHIMSRASVFPFFPGYIQKQKQRKSLKSFISREIEALESDASSIIGTNWSIYSVCTQTVCRRV